MRTTFMQQIITAALWSVAMTSTCTFATPMPTSVIKSLDVPSYIRPRNNDVFSSYHGTERLAKVRTTESDTSTFQIIPRDSGATPISAIETSINNLHAPIHQIHHRFCELSNPTPEHLADITSTSEFFRSTLAMHNNWTKLQSSVAQISTIVTTGMQFSVQRLVSLLKLHNESGITEENGAPLIHDFMKMAKGLMMEELEDKQEKDKKYCSFVLAEIDQIVNIGLGWKVIGELEKVRLDIQMKLKALHGGSDRRVHV